uniref:Tc1-like transposase DDE domain-containing protein n=1 Tax=Haptolina ericina TaxID=156174 RepID=A0A7S3F389_9EUKA|mmetsp:Transcript_50674/g.113881  ORF Transcript_50674/g.113881 Transcript_50674/m.113881 type:complete len:331 (+) Transcript_50674:190-1182(+)
MGRSSTWSARSTSCRMMVNGQNVLEAANFVKCCQMTVTKYWTMWLTTGKLSKEKDKPGPKPALGVGALLYLFYLVSGNRVYTIAQYRERLREDLGHVVSDWVVMRALQKLGLHRKKPSVKKVEALAPHSQLLRQRYFDVVFAFRLLIGPSSIHRYIHIDETYVNFDNTRARKARAPNGTAATVVDFDSRGPKYGQMAALCTAGFFAQFVYPCVERSTTRDLFEWWLCFILMPVLAQAGGGFIVVLDRAAYHDMARIENFLSLIGCGVLVLAPYQSQDNGIEYIHHIQHHILRRDVDFSRAAPMTAMHLAGELINENPQHCANIMRHVILG